MHNKPHSELTKSLLRQIAKKLNIRPPSRKGSRWTESQRIKTKEKMLGRKITWGDKISKALTGKVQSEEHRRHNSEAHKKTAKREDKHSNWKGDNVKYDGLHKWVPKHLGKPTRCEHCGTDGLTGRNIHWANKSGEYKRDVSDWLRLCSKCHAI